MNRRTFLQRAGLTALLPLWPRPLVASKSFRRRRPSDADWPSRAAWKRLSDEVDGNLIAAEFPHPSMHKRHGQRCLQRPYRQYKQSLLCW